MATLIDDSVDIYRELATVPTPSKASVQRIDDTHIRVYSEWSQRDLERSENIKLAREHILTLEGEKIDILTASSTLDISKEVWSKRSPSGTLRAVVRSVKSKDGKDKQYIEVWDKNSKIKNIDVEAQEKHGKIYESDGQLGTFQWAAFEGHLLYIAEKKLPKFGSYFDSKPTKSPEEEEKESIAVNKVDEFVFRQDWGEQLTSKHQPVLCVLNIDTGYISVLEGIPDNISPGQAVWSPDDAGIVFVGWEQEPWRLGLIYCPIRKSAIYYLDIQAATCTSLSSDSMSVRSPRFSPDQLQLVYLQNKIGGPHRQCSQLVLYDWVSKETTVLVDIVQKLSGDQFTGLYLETLPQRCWSRDNSRIVLQTEWRSKREVIVVNTSSKTVTRVTKDKKVGGWQVADIHQDLILAACSAPDKPPYLVIGKLPDSGNETNITWVPLDSDHTVFVDISWRIMMHNRSPDGDSSCEFESVLLLPHPEDEKPKTKPPLVVYPHGGPHTMFPADFFLYMTGFCRCGYAVLLVNYRGSTGFGQEGVDSLPGNVGTEEISDVQFAVECVAESAFNLVDKTQVYVIGGSHGGFITAHLIGQYPGYYRAACLRNPVINMASMFGISDIPDWVYVESGLQFDMNRIAHPSDLEAAWKRSPISHVHRVKTPAMIMLGACDRRVPPQQGWEFYRALKAQGTEVRMLVYPDNQHPINKVDAEANAFINVIKWWKDHSK